MDNNNGFDVDSYYGNKSNEYSSKSNYNKFSSSSDSYDEVFKSYSDDNKKRKHKKKNRDNKGIVKKILIIIFILVIIGGIGFIIYRYKDEIIEIVEPKKNPIIEVEVLDSNLSLIVGDTRKLNYKMTNSEDVSLLTFASSNTTVAKVDKEGNIKAIGAGDAIISVSYMGEKGKVTKTCYVTIKNVDVDEINQNEQKIQEDIKKKAEEEQAKRQEEIKKRIEEAQRSTKDIAEAENRKHAAEAAKKAAEAAEAARRKALEAANKNK